MRKLSFAMMLLCLNAMAMGKTRLALEDLKIVESLEKVDVLRVYTSQKIKNEYRHVITNQTDVDSDISNVSKKEYIKKVVKKDIKGKIINIERDFVDNSVKGVHVSFDKGCQKLAQKCTYYFNKNRDGEFKLIAVPLKLSVGEEVKENFELSSEKIAKRAYLTVIKKEIDEVKKDTVQSTGW